MGRLYRCLRAVVRAVTPRMTTTWEEPFSGNPSVFVCNHVGAFGPIDMVVKFPLRDEVRVWCNEGIMNRKTCPAYVRQDYWWKPGCRLEPLYNATLPYIAAAVLPPILQSAPTIPVYHDARVMTTMRQSMKALKEGKHLVIFPEQPSGFGEHHSWINTGWLNVCTMFYRATGKNLTLYPVHIDQKKHCFEVQKPVMFDGNRTLEEQQDALVKKYDRLMKKREKQEAGNVISIGENEIAEVVAQWTKIPVQKLAEKESERLLKLEKTLHKRVIGQEEAVTAVARAMRRGRVGLKDPNRPIGSFLFLGPTGVGKTELSKALAEAMFGSEDAMIRVDMSEYMEGHSVSKMIGSPPGYVGFEEGGQLSEKVRRNPYSVVLFDEIEKAHPDVFNVLLQVLDDGHITDSKGRKVSFKNTVLIMTSNAGAQRIVDPKNLGFATEKSETKDYEKMKSNVMEEVKRSFKPEFINRIDDIIVFHQLNNENMKEIVNLLASNLYKRCEDQLGIHLTITAALKEHLVSKYADNKMGARPLKRAIQSVVEDALAEEILQKKVVPGDKVSAGFKDGKVVFTVKN